MSENTTLDAVLGVIRREWWIVVLAVVVAGAVGYAGAGKAKPQHTAKAVVVVDFGTISRLRGLPYPEDIVRDSAAPKLRERFAKAVGISAGDLGSGLSVTTQGSPQTRIVVTFRATDAELAQRAARAVASEIDKYVADLASGEVWHQQTIIQEAERALSEMQAARGKASPDPWKAAEFSFDRWQVEKDLADAQNALRQVEEVYSYDGETTLGTRSASSARRDSALGAALVGLALGCVVAASREVFARDKAA